MIEAKEFVNGIVIDVELGKVEIVRAGQPTDRRFECATASLAPVDDPFEHAHVFTETGPEEFSVCAFAEPIHIKNQRRIGEPLSDVQPVLEIIALIGTPSPFSTSGSSAGLLRIGVVNRLFGCAAFSFDSGVQSFPRQSIACAGGSPSLPSHHTSPSSVRATLV